MSFLLLHVMYVAWIMSALAAYGCMVIAGQMRLEPTRLQQVLQAGWKFGMLSLVCVLTASNIVVFTNFSTSPLADPSAVMEWSRNLTRGLTGVEQFAVISFLPTGICWFRERTLRARGIRGDANQLMS